jgi:hypothetical protein
MVLRAKIISDMGGSLNALPQKWAINCPKVGNSISIEKFYDPDSMRH